MANGNGGCAADAEHMVGELMKGFLLKRPLTPAQHAQFTTHYPHVGTYLADHLQYGLPAIALSGHPALATAFANDVSADMLFAQQVFVYGQPQDVVLIAGKGHEDYQILGDKKIHFSDLEISQELLQ